MLYVDNQSHEHFNPNVLNKLNYQETNNIIPIEELNNTDYIDTARTRNTIPSSILRPLIQNTKDDIHIVPYKLLNYIH